MGIHVIFGGGKDKKTTVAWEVIKQLYDKENAGRKKALRPVFEKAYGDIIKRLKKTVPEAMENPYMLTLNKWLSVYDKFHQGKAQREETREIKFALKSLKKIIEKHYWEEYVPQTANALRMRFSSDETLACAHHWLLNQGWQKGDLRELGYTSISTRLYTKGSKRLVLGANMSWRRPKTDQYWHSNLSSLSPGFGAVLWNKVHMGNVMNVFAFPDDLPTRKALKPYLKYFKRMGIKIYLVRSAEKVEEL